MDLINEKCLLVGLDDGREKGRFEYSMEELAGLAKACSMETVGIITQKAESEHKGLYIGSGKVQEVREAAEKLETDVIIFNDTLTPAQLRNLQKELGKPILDRTGLILDIFETRARTREAKLQVESARLQYLLPRLVGMHAALSRQGGTSGSMSSRGAGEKKLELDRRQIEHRLAQLRRELEEVSRERDIRRRKRVTGRIPLVALVGYTNAGKSTVLNRMLDMYAGEEAKHVLERDMLFATLDTTVRHIAVENNQDFLLADTVGFIHKLPHGLIKAFRSTLEEVKEADLILQIVDYSDENHPEHKKTTEAVLSELGAGHIPMIMVYNKADCLKEPVSYPRLAGEQIVYISAKEDSSIRMLAELVVRRLYAGQVSAEFLFPYDQGAVTAYFMEHAQILAQEYVEDGVQLKVKCHQADREKYKQFLLS